jgi:hypothetical protein
MNPTLSYRLALERSRELRAEAERAPGSRGPARSVAEAAVRPPSSRRRAVRAALLRVARQPSDARELSRRRDEPRSTGSTRRSGGRRVGPWRTLS